MFYGEKYSQYFFYASSTFDIYLLNLLNRRINREIRNFFVHSMIRVEIRKTQKIRKI